jgi:REP element-mobilizing transposase RayT
MRSTYKTHNIDGTYFITSSIVNWINIFNSEKYFNILIEAINYYTSNKSLTVYAYVIMRNHFHMICKADNLTNIIRLIKTYTAKEIVKELQKDSEFNLLEKFKANKKEYKTESVHQIWQEGFHPKEILNNSILKQKIEYIHNNPVKENYCLKTEDWVYSSAGFYGHGTKSLISLKIDIAFPRRTLGRSGIYYMDVELSYIRRRRKSNTISDRCKG